MTKEGGAFPSPLNTLNQSWTSLEPTHSLHTVHSNQAASLLSLLINAEALVSTERIMQEPAQVSRCWKRYQRTYSKKNAISNWKNKKTVFTAKKRDT